MRRKRESCFHFMMVAAKKQNESGVSVSHAMGSRLVVFLRACCNNCPPPGLVIPMNLSCASYFPVDWLFRCCSELAALDQFLNLSDAELAQMEQVIARVRAMSPAQRAALRDEIAKFRQLPEPQRLQLRQGWGWKPAGIQDGWREMMQGAPPEKRAEVQAKLQALTPDQKTGYRRKLVEEYLKAKSAKK